MCSSFLYTKKAPRTKRSAVRGRIFVADGKKMRFQHSAKSDFPKVMGKK